MAKPESIIKLVGSVCFLLIIAALILIQRNPATGYELSIYSATPLLVWVFLGLSIVCGIGIVVHQAFNPSDKSRNLWIIGLLLIIVSNLVIFSLPILRGYAFYGHGGDVNSHVGYVVDIVSSGRIPSYNIYPVTHIEIASISLISGIAPLDLNTSVSLLFYPLFIAFTYLLSTQLLPKHHRIIATLLGALLPFYYYTVVFPQGFSAIFIPLILFLFFKTSPEKSVASVVVFILLLFLFPFFHPSTCLVLMAAFIVIELARLLFNGWCKWKQGGLAVAGSSTHIRVEPSAICFIVLMMWIWQHYSFWQSNILHVARWFRGEMTTSMLTTQVSPMLAKLNLDWIGILELWWKLYGYIFIYLVLATVASAWIFRKTFSTPNRNLQNLFIIAVVFLFAGAVELQHLFRPMIGLSFGRFLDFILVLSPVLAAFCLYELSMKYGAQRDKFIKVGIMMLLIVVSINGTLKLHGSPYIYIPNNQVTCAELQGWQWLISQKNSEVKVLSFVGKRIPTMFLGKEEANRQARIWRNTQPDHFGYDQFDSLGESFTEDRYMLLSKWDRQLYVDGAWSVVGRFKQADYNKLESDKSVNRLYTTGEMEAWWVEGKAIPEEG